MADPLDPSALGRVHLDTPPPHLVDAIRAKAISLTGELSPQNNGAIVVVPTTEGINAAVVVRKNGHFFVTGYIGKKWGEPVSAGGEIAVKW
jgi:hypothetical protein